MPISSEMEQPPLKSSHDAADNKRIFLSLGVTLTCLFATRSLSGLFSNAWLQAAAVYLPILIAVLILHRIFSHTAFSHFFAHPQNTKAAAVLPLILTIAMGVTLLKNLFFHYFPHSLPQNPKHSTVLQIVVIDFLLPSILEELLCRGVVLRMLRRLGNCRAIVLSAIFFAALHSDPLQMLYCLLAGILLGAVTIQTHSVLPAIFLHAAVNAASLIISLLPVPADRIAFFVLLAVSGVLSLLFIRDVTRPWRHIRKQEVQADWFRLTAKDFMTPFGCVSILILIFNIVNIFIKNI